ncbi:hypothetical protein UF75_3487 [Desulfosporosinus sp. I2]|nr:hypothetical protein UF75_3487 [Desulfosporosinus sp. I2]
MGASIQWEHLFNGSIYSMGASIQGENYISCSLIGGRNIGARNV